MEKPQSTALNIEFHLWQKLQMGCARPKCMRRTNVIFNTCITRPTRLQHQSTLYMLGSRTTVLHTNGAISTCLLTPYSLTVQAETMVSTRWSHNCVLPARTRLPELPISPNKRLYMTVIPKTLHMRNKKPAPRLNQSSSCLWV